MTEVPDVQPLPQTHRRLVFILALLTFVITVPTFVFYAVGYRFDLTGEERSIMRVGGMYISATAEETEIYLNDEPVEDMRIFQRAAYIQNLTEGVHQIHVQGEGVHTWVKELPVFSHYVTEATSFNMPLVPQVRLIAEYETTEGLPVLFEAATSTPLASASTTQTFVATTTTATSTFNQNAESVYIETLFASSTEERLLLEEQREILSEPFVFSAEREHASSVQATTTKAQRDTRLYEENGEVYIEWLGDESNTPYYYCVRYENKASTSERYGSHVQRSVVAQVVSRFTEAEEIITESQMRDQRWCRDRIKIDRLNQDIIWFDYYPNSTDLVLMHLTDGLYVVEVDDRAWQNTQLLYGGDAIEVVKDGDRIFVYDRGYYFEVFTELQS